MSRRIGIAAAVIAAAFAALALVARPVPGWLLAAFGGPRWEIDRYGGTRMTVQAPDGDVHVVDTIGVSSEGTREMAHIIEAGGVRFVVVVDDDAADRSGFPREQVDTWRAEDDDTEHHMAFVTGATRAEIDAKLARWKPPAGMRVGYERVDSPPDRPDRQATWRAYLLSTETALDASSIEGASVRYNETNRPEVEVTFDDHGRRALADLTRRIRGHKLAVVIGDEVKSAPVIESEIRRGVAVISMGGADPEGLEHEADALVVTLQPFAGAARSGHVLEAHYIAPTRAPAAKWLARIVPAVLAGLLAGLLAWLAAWWIAPERIARVAAFGEARVWPRVAWTAGAVLLLWLAWQLTLPGFNDFELARIDGSHREALEQTSVLTLGVMPLVTAAGFVELAALIVPRWRRLRHGGPAARRKLGRAAAVVAIAIAFVQAHFAMRYYEGMERYGAEVYSASRASAHWLVVLTMVGGTMLAAWIVSIIGHRGLGNGYAVVIVAAWLAGVPWHATTVLAVAAVACIAVIAGVLMSARIGRMPLPASGATPLASAAAVASIVSLMGMAGWLVPFALLDAAHRMQRWAEIELALVAVFAFVWAWVFARPALSRATRGEWLRAACASAGVLVAVDAIALVTHRIAPASEALVDVASVLIAVATALDIADEVRARRRGVLVPVWPLHAPLAVEVVRERLAAAGIAHHFQSARLRVLLWFSGPWAPIMVLVPPDRVADAAKIMIETT
ncbi:MAG TPA: hypothetical protein VGF94_15945 [Kofleriaceae bacterium]